MANVSEESIKKMVNDAFRKYDLDTDGTLDMREVGLLMNDCMRRKHEP
jgi:Ca2+-binding EF-hand superfamily protein